MVVYLRSALILFGTVAGGQQGIVLLQLSADKQESAKGFPLRLADGFPSQARADEFREFWQKSQSSKHSKRVIRWLGEVEHKGITDRMWCITLLMSIAASVDASLEIPTPEETLGGGHPVDAPPWWDTYFNTAPILKRIDKSTCDPDVAEIYLEAGWLDSEKTSFDRTMGDQLDALYDTDRSLCLTIRGNLFNIDWGVAEELKLAGGEIMTFQTSHVITTAVNEARSFLESKLRNKESRYNAVHIRQGDRGKFDCLQPSNVVDKMLELGQNATDMHGISPSSTWFVMTLGTQDWLDLFKEQANAVGLNTFFEEDVPAIVNQKDNMMKYMIDSCVWPGGELGLYTWEVLGFSCEVAGEPIIGNLGCPPSVL